jgi:hypothetical protein
MLRCARILFAVVLLLGLLPGAVRTQSIYQPPAGARGAALGGAGVALQDVHAVWLNPAGLGAVREFSGAAYAEQRFGLAELQQYELAVAAPTNLGSFGLQIGQVGFSDFRRQRISLLYGRRLFDRFALGIGFTGLNTIARTYENRFAATASLGLLGEVSSRLHVGFRVFSPLQVEFAPDDRIPTFFTAGLAYRPNRGLLLLADLEKDIDFPARVRVGLEYRISDPLTLRLGVATAAAEVSFGVGYRILEFLRLDFATRYHRDLGFTPGFGLVYTKD